MSAGPVELFDRRRTLQELFGSLPAEAVSAAIGGLCDQGFLVEDESGSPVVAGARWSGQAHSEADVRFELETVGRLSVCAGSVSAAAAAAVLEVLLQSAARYQMAADLHLETVHEDYRVLLQKHAELAESEARYRALCTELEQRVSEQVCKIEAAQRQLFQAEKMASIGQLAAGMAHEINNPLGFIRSNLSSAQQYVRRLAAFGKAVKATDSPLAHAWRRADLDFVIEDFTSLLEESIGGSDRIGRIVADLKTFSSIDSSEMAEVDLNENLRAAVNVARTRSGSTRQITLDLGPLPPYRCNPGRLNQVFLSLLQNAAQAIGPEGEIRVSSRQTDGEVQIRVQDNGSGIDKADLSRVFDPFFTTREVGAGTGLGLTVSRDVVLAHKGRIEIESEPGQGTVVTVALPLTEGGN